MLHSFLQHQVLSLITVLTGINKVNSFTVKLLFGDANIFAALRGKKHFAEEHLNLKLQTSSQVTG